MESEFQREHALEDTTEKELTSPMPNDVHESVHTDAVSIQPLDEPEPLGENSVDSCGSEENQPDVLPSCSLGQELVASDDNSKRLDFDDIFLDELFPSEASPQELLELQNKEKISELRSEKNMSKLEGIWKKVTIIKFQNTITSKRCLMLISRIYLLLKFSSCHIC